VASEPVISASALARRRHWVSEIVRISGAFGEDAPRVESELSQEVARRGLPSLHDHLRLCGAIPESYGHDSSEEKLYSKYTDALLAVAFRYMGLTSTVLTERANVADVEVVGRDYSFVADAKAFRLSRTAKNQKDFKIQAMDNWKHGKRHAVLVAPLYQLPSRSSQIYQQAIERDVCVFSYVHLTILLGYADATDADAAQGVLHRVLQVVGRLHPTDDSYTYWRAINEELLNAGGMMPELWHAEKLATAEALRVAKEEGRTYLASERERIMRLTREEAIHQLVVVHKLDSRARQIDRVADGGLLDVAAP
jgi:hypothetical protein